MAPTEFGPADVLAIEADLENQGEVAGEETGFLFIRDKVASVTRPVLELKGFGKIDLQPGGRGTVELQLPASELRFLGAGLEPVLEAGEVEILVGPSAQRSVLLVEIIRVFV